MGREIGRRKKGGNKMDKKNIAIIVLSIALLITLIGFISASSRVNKIIGEKSEFMAKIRETENLTDELSQSIADLKSMLGRAQKEKEKLVENTEKMKERLNLIAAEETKEKKDSI